MDAALPGQKKMLGLATRIAAFKNALRPEELAELLGVTKKTVMRWALAGKIPSFKLPSGQTRFDQRLTAEWAKCVRGDIRRRKH